MEEEPSPRKKSFFLLLGHALRLYWHSVVAVVTPFLGLLLFYFFGDYPATRCAYVMFNMAVFWITEALPLAVTSMLPILGFPILNIMDSDDVCMLYLKDTNMLLVGGFIVALAIQYSNLHKRIALKVILLIGCTHFRLTLGLALCTMAVSMWISNTAATAMMSPIAFAVLLTLEEEGLLHVYEPTDQQDEGEDPFPSRTTIAYFLLVAYASAVGGTGTLVGTGTNLTMKGIFEDRFPDAPTIDFGVWMAYNFIGMFITTILIWLCLNWQFLGFLRTKGADEEIVSQKLQDKEAAKFVVETTRKVITTKYEELGEMSYHELNVAVIFIILVICWVLREPGFMKGWAEVVTDTKVKDSLAAITACLLFFVLPRNLSFKNALSSNRAVVPEEPAPPLLTWKYTVYRLPWGLLFLIGAGFALARGSKVSGLSEIMGKSMTNMKNLPPFIILTVVCTFAVLLTQLSSNVAIANLLLPPIIEMAVEIHLNPMYLMIPVTLCCSFAYTLPAGTPPNGIIAGIVFIRTKDMMLGGVLPMIISELLVLALFPTWGNILYKTSEFPDWAKKNSTI